MTVFTQWMLNIKTMLPVSTHSHIYIEDYSHPRDVVLAVSFPHAGLWSYVTLYTFPFSFFLTPSCFNHLIVDCGPCMWPGTRLKISN